MTKNSYPQFRHIVITGASSGIGEALALYYAQPGVRLSLTGQNIERLDQVAQACRDKGAEVETNRLCVTDREGKKQWLEALDQRQPIDLLIANAGISAGMGARKNGENTDQVRRLFEVNVVGVLNSIDPLLPRMIARGRGHIALMSSLAGFRGWPGAPAYCATKAAVRVYGEGLRGAVAAAGVQIHVICPGFVKSRMTDVNDFPMPFMLSAEKAAVIIANGIVRGKGRIAFPYVSYFIVWFLLLMPERWSGKLLRCLPVKREFLNNESS